MDPNNNNHTSTSGCWDLDMTMSMGNQLLLDHLHMDLFHPMVATSQSHHVLPPVGFHPVCNQGDVVLGGGGGGGVGVGGGLDYQEERGGRGGRGGEEEEEEERLGAMKEMMYRIAAMQPVDIDPATIKRPKRRNVRISDDPQSIAARHRRERISERIRILQRLVPGGTKMDTASMLDEAILYVKFLKRQVQELQSQQHAPSTPPPLSLLPCSSPVGGQLAVTPVSWTVRPDALGPSSSSVGAPPGLGFGFSSDGSCSQMH